MGTAWGLDVKATRFLPCVSFWSVEAGPFQSQKGSWSPPWKVDVVLGINDGLRLDGGWMMACLSRMPFPSMRFDFSASAICVQARLACSLRADEELKKQHPGSARVGAPEARALAAHHGLRGRAHTPSRPSSPSTSRCPSGDQGAP